MRCAVGVGLLLIVASGLRPVEAAPSLDDRVAARRAVEDVLWRHRIWPAENVRPKPPLSAVLSDAEIRARVIDDLRKSKALDLLWHRPVTASMLDAELDRMRAASRAPEVLTEMLSTIGNDPALAREAIARPALVDRLMRSWYAQDARYHGDLRRAAERGAGGTVVEFDWDESEEGLDGKLDRLVDEENAFRTYRVIGRRGGTTRVAVTSWPKRSLESFWSERAASFPADTDVPGGETLPRVQPAVVASCANDTWHPLGNVTPSARYAHTAVWTGSEMIVWGGWTPSGVTGTGGRYVPATDAWFPTASAGAPPARLRHDAVWTGTQMIVWGGQQDEVSPYGLLNDGARYDPLSDTWSLIAAAGAPSPRREATLVWTGSRAVVFGGRNLTDYLNTGGLYDPGSNSWTATSMTGVPGVRGSHTAVWTGSRMIVWGGFDDFGDLQTGGRFDPVANSWQPTSMSNVPPGRKNHTAVWTGSRMIVWGGYESLLGHVFNDGSSYDPATDAWTPISQINAPDNRQEQTAVWTGSVMIVWGGTNQIGDEYFDGGRYDPVGNAWVPVTSGGGPVARHLHTAVWTGSEMVVWGGIAEPYPPGSGTFYYNSGSRYAPATDSWVPTSIQTTGPPSARSFHTAVWTGAETVFWGGSVFNNGGRYVSATDTWYPTTTSGAPAARSSHTAVWTGTQMIVWGGDDLSFIPIGTGGRYNPTSDTWAGVSIAGAPNGVSLHTAVWTGSRMIVWGGRRSGMLTNEGGRYDPSTDTWQATSIANAPDPRFSHSAVWTGTRMVVWGGSDLFGISSEGVNTGGRYDPATNTWTATSLANAPQGRVGQVSVWTGSSMIVWGGSCCFDGTLVLQGGRYDPSTDGWSSVATVQSPTGRNYASAVWSGFEMIVWGGVAGTRLNTGGRYSPATDSWTATSVAGAPAARDFHTATWAGDKMIVFGGTGAAGGAIDTGGSYCACTTIYRDLDGDGWGNTFDVDQSCNGSVPSGYSLQGGDCSDSVNYIHPGALDNTCNAVDEDCNGDPDDLWVGGLSQCGLGVCHAFGFFECTGGQIINNCTPGTPLDVFDTACNAQDDDCDGAMDEEYTQWQDFWTATAGAPNTRTNHSSVWTGTEMIVFGGDNGSGTVKVGGDAYAPGPNTWRSLASGPAKRWRHTAVWSGSRMIVWGGDDNVATVYNGGSRYDPATDTWAATTTTAAPTARLWHSAVWTGSSMIVWGGRDATTNFNSGSRYDPVANTWSATTTTGAPAARFLHSAVWTGTEMIVWGGQSTTSLASGSRYNPATNSWSATASAGSFAGRYGHVAVWTGTEMIVWGGTDGTSYFSNGGRYNPSTNTWSGVSNTGAPSQRAFASAAWTGSELIVWGGADGTGSGNVLADGARYNPATNTWSVVTPVGNPSSRGRAGGVWTGSELIVWGGDPNGTARGDGGRYKPLTQCGTGGCQQTGHSTCTGGVVSFQCVPIPPSPEVCDGIDNDCNVAIDEGIPIPTGHPVLTLGKLATPSNTLFSWTSVAGTTGYDTVRGYLSTLRITGGDFTASTHACAFDNLAATQFQDNIPPFPDDGYWFLVRAVNACSGNGTFDDALPPQQGSRDAELNAAPGACP